MPRGNKRNERKEEKKQHHGSKNAVQDPGGEEPDHGRDDPPPGHRQPRDVADPRPRQVRAGRGLRARPAARPRRPPQRLRRGDAGPRQGRLLDQRQGLVPDRGAPARHGGRDAHALAHAQRLPRGHHPPAGTARRDRRVPLGAHRRGADGPPDADYVAGRPGRLDRQGRGLLGQRHAHRVRRRARRLGDARMDRRRHGAVDRRRPVRGLPGLSALRLARRARRGAGRHGPDAARRRAIHFVFPISI